MTLVRVIARITASEVADCRGSLIIVFNTRKAGPTFNDPHRKTIRQVRIIQFPGSRMKGAAGIRGLIGIEAANRCWQRLFRSFDFLRRMVDFSC